MSVQIFINLLIAVLWMFFQDNWSTLTFLTGYLIGIGVVFSFRRFFSSTFYLKKAVAVFNLLVLFIYELVSSSILVIRQIMRPKLNITPGVITVETDLEGEWEITLLSLLITLTPGSVVLDLSPNGDKLFIHAMDIPESSRVVMNAKGKFEKAIKEVTR